MSDILPDPESSNTTPDAALRRLVRVGIALGAVETVMTDILGRVQQPPGPPVIPILSLIGVEATSAATIARNIGGTDDRTALSGDNLVAADPDSAVTPDDVLIRRLTRVARVLARIDERMVVLSRIFQEQPPGPPVIPVLSTIVAEGTSVASLAARIAAGGGR